jgi:ribose 5-phosphate isomerase A
MSKALDDLHDREKQAASRAAADLIETRSVVGLGSGSTATYFLRFLAERVRRGLKIVGVPTSQKIADLAGQLGIRLATLDQYPAIDIDVDGADEIDPHLNLIKGGGGAFLREKAIASVSRRFIVIADSAKRVSQLGKFPLPVEVIPFAQAVVRPRIEALEATICLREDGRGNAYVTDNGNHVLDCKFVQISDPAGLATKLRSIPGVVEHGLFIDMAEMALVGTDASVSEMRR